MNKLFLVFCLTSTLAFAQISEPGTPLSFSTILSAELNTIEFPEVDIQELQKEDSLDQLRNRPMRFGKAHEANISISNSGKWEIINNENKVWRLEITCPEAFSVNLVYSKFKIPTGGKLFLYNADKSYLLGAFTSANNQDANEEFATGLIPGEKIIIEYNSSINIPEPQIEISRVVHGYKNFFLFGDSGPCNNNVNCPEGLDWADQTNSVAMIVLAGGTRWCSGAMINNTCEDGTPYFLTANHCLTGTGVGNWMFYFNYQSPTCANIDGPTNQIVSGARLIATSAASDFALLELDSRPPAAYNAFYSGWSNFNISTDTSVAIHHPSGDIKKISFSNQNTQSTAYLASTIDSNETHWRVPTWDDGTTEGGSSGSPLFNTEKQIVGQLHGGFASCNSITSDWYGKISYSWEEGSASNSRLSDWLDPSLSNADTMNGNYFSFTPALEASISSINSPSENSCYSIQILEISIKNKGLDTINSTEIIWEIPGLISDTLNWIGHIMPGQVRKINLDTLTFNPGNYNLIAEIISTNGQADNNSCNNLKAKSFNIIQGNEVTFRIRTDNWPEELNLEIADTSGNVLQSLASFQANKLDSFFFCLSPGCYDFTLFDSYGDGLTPGFFNIEYNDSIYFTASGAFGNCTGSPMPGGCSVTYRLCLDSNLLVQLPVASYQLSDTLYKIGDTILIQDLSSNFPNSWEWKLSNDTSDYNFSTQNVFLIATEEGWYDISLKVSNIFGDDSIFVSRAFRVEKGVGLQNDLSEELLKVFPNPAVNELNINYTLDEEIQIEIVSLEGKSLKELNISKGKYKLDIAGIPAGLYLIKIHSNSISQTRKILIQ